MSGKEVAERSKAIDCKSIEIFSTLVQIQPSLRVISSVGRAFRLHRNSRWFESVITQIKWMIILLLIFCIAYIIQLLFFVHKPKTEQKYLHLRNKAIYFSVFYLFENLIIVFALHFFYGRNFIFLLLEKMQKNTILKDPQDFLYILFDTGKVVLFITIILILFFLAHFYCSSMLRFFEHKAYLFLRLVLLHLTLIGSWIFFTDLITTHWEIFYQDKTFDFQPDLIRWYTYYKEEFFDLYLNLFLIIFISIFGIFLNGNMQRNGAMGLRPHLLFRFLIILLLFVFSMSFFGGESFLRDFILCITIFLFSEIILFTLVFFKILKRFKELKG